MPVFIRQPLSGSNSGIPITVTATAAAGAQIMHQVQATATNVLELVTLWINNGSTSANVLPIAEVTNGTNSEVIHSNSGGQTVASAVPPVMIFNQLPLSGTDSAIHIYATQGVTFYAWGHVDRIATG